jgi:Holliday junction DNA helicase RuvA
MIEYLSGKVLTRLPHSLILDVNGVGYGVQMPLSSLCEAPAPGSPTALWIETYVREDSIRLFGFLTLEDKQAFQMLTSVSGIGPRIALAVLSSLSARDLRAVVLNNKVSHLESVPGIGKRTAEKMILELRPKMEKASKSGATAKSGTLTTGKAGSPTPSPSDIDGLDDLDAMESVFYDVRSALENLGYKDKDVTQVLALLEETHRSSPETADFQVIMKSALKTIRSGV